MSTKLIIPILNKRVTLYSGPTWSLSKEISIETISNEEYGLLYSTSNPIYTSLLTSKTKCIRIEGIDPNNSEELSNIEGSKICFLLNFFKEVNPITLYFAVQITKVRKSKLDKIIDLGVINDVHLKTNDSYKPKSGTRRDIITKYYEIITEVCKKYPNITLTFDRFNSALYRKELFDKIIDITIALESLIDGTDELSYRFALYNAWASDDNNDERKNNFKLLRLLYSARSTIVHGSSISKKTYNKVIQPIDDEWGHIVKMCKKILGYYILFLYKNDIKKWYEHQRNLALNIEDRIKF